MMQLREISKQKYDADIVKQGSTSDTALICALF